MVNEAKLSGVLSEFARTVITDFPIQAILDHLVQRIVELLPVSGAGVTLIGVESQPHYIAASDAAALQYERLQSTVGEGPCLAAYDTGMSVAVPDLRVDGRFPRFTPGAVEAGLAAVFTFPLGRGATPIGALDLYRSTPGALDDDDMAAAQTLADVATAYLLNAQARDAATAASKAFLHNSLHDPLTGLPNRQLLAERLEHAADRAERRHTYAAVLFVDLDRFKDINDRHGHHIGDAVLLAVTERLRNLVRAGDTLARVSGDEFVIFCEEINAPSDAELLARRVGQSMRAPFVMIGGEALSITASVGIAYAGPGHHITPQLVIDADLAMYRAKSRGGAGHDVAGHRGASMANGGRPREVDLRNAMASRELSVAYQPVVRACDRSIVGVEALLRWDHPVHGPIDPPTVIAVAERSHLIDEIGEWILRRACRDHRGWIETHAGLELDLAVNVSVRQLFQPAFPAIVRSALSTCGTSPADLILEVTENIFIDDDEVVAAVLDELHRSGVRIALDDYGTGYSSLHYLAHLPIDILKIDRCFVTDLAEPTGRIIVGSVNALAHDLGLRVVAEGVETVAQHDIVASIGCDLAQGFHYAHPMDVHAIDTLLHGGRTLPAPPTDVVPTRPHVGR